MKSGCGVILFLFILFPGKPNQSAFALQEGAFKLRVEVDLVTVEVSVLDKEGLPVRNLKREDFRLYEDGKRQDLISFDEVSAESNPSSLGAGPLDEVAPPRGKTILILFAEVSRQVHYEKAMRESAEAFVSKYMRPQDLVAVGVLGNSARIRQPFTRNRNEVLTAVRQPSDWNGGIHSPFDEQRALQKICSSLQRLKGPKTVIIYRSHYFPVGQWDTEYGKTLDLARKANVTFHTVDLGHYAMDSGVLPQAVPIMGRNGIVIAPPVWTPANVNPLAVDSGGECIGLVGVDAKLEQLDRQTSNYYILGFQSGNPRHDGSVRKLKVKTEVNGATLKYRTAYQDRNPVDVLESSRQEKALIAALASPDAVSRLPVNFRPAYFYESPRSARVLITAGIGTEKITLRKKGDQLTAELNVMGAAFADDGGLAGRFSQKLAVACEKGRESEFRKQPYLYRNYFSLRPGRYRLKIAASDESGNLGSMERSLEIPPFPEHTLAVSSLILIDKMAQTPELIRNLQSQLLDEQDPLIYGDVQIEPRVHHRFRSGTAIPVLFRLYNLPGEAGQAGWTAGAILVDEKGKEYSAPQIHLQKLMVPAGDMQAVVSFGLEFPEVPPAKYALRIEITEAISRQTATVQTDIELF